ncbi:helix-turn-helix domain-containing protein [Sessilibacter corallicola]|uniref:HTH cro/C1-type domain-containing protein n=1 Tax=Sessilibacter corallicola TaxID=2904075 RepID=A0ABQ0A8D7_9GAMM
MTPFGNYLEQLRRKRGLQQQQLAEGVGINACYISGMEGGRKNPASKEVLNRIIKVLDLSTEEVETFWLRVEQSKRSIKIPQETSAKEFELISELWKKLGSLSEPQIHIISAALKITTTRGGQ